MTATTNAKNLRQDKGKFSLIAVQILGFAWNPNMVREVKTISKIQTNCVMMVYITKYC